MSPEERARELTAQIPLSDRAIEIVAAAIRAARISLSRGPSAGKP